MSREQSSFDDSGHGVSGEILREVRNALCSASGALGKKPDSSLGPTLFELTGILQQFDAIDEAKRLAEAEGIQQSKQPREDLGQANSAGLFGCSQEPNPLLLSPARLASLRDLVIRAYAEVRNGCSADRVVADDMLNDEFLRKCWELGAVATAYELNWHLLNTRKAGVLQVSGATRRFRIPANRLNEFAFATEFSIRHIQDYYADRDDWHVSLDRILCDPKLAAEFDDVAKRIAPGYSSLEYRWAAFAIRKSRRPYTSPFALSFEHIGDTRAIHTRQLPTTAGIYRFAGDGNGREFYVGETDNLRRQIEIHFDNNGARIFPDWLTAGVNKRIDLLVAPMQSNTSVKDRGRAKTYCTDIWYPCFNWLGVRPSAA